MRNFFSLLLSSNTVNLLSFEFLKKIYNFSSPLFAFKFVFLLEILVAEFFIAYHMKKKEKFSMRLSICLAATVIFVFLLPVPFYNAAYSSFLFMLIFSFTLVLLLLCFEEPLGSIIFCGFFAYNEQHISYQLYNWICMPFEIDAASNIYGAESVSSKNGLSILLFIVPHIVVYLICWAVTSYRVGKNGNKELSIKSSIGLVASVAIIFINVVVNAIVVYGLPETVDNFTQSIIIFYNLFSCVLALILQLSIIGQAELKDENMFLENLWRKNERICELSKSNIDFINMKCHDLRHRIRNMRSGNFDGEELKEIEDAIYIYDGIMQTGNETLDVILSEESIFCNKNNIKLLCNIDGKQLNFMRRGDLYSIFQNGIHNAIDAVMKIDDEARRIIRINVKRINEMISLHMENYMADGENPEMLDGLPVSPNADNKFHGFGMKSIRISVERYGGYVCAEAKDGSFYLDIMIPATNNENNITASDNAYGNNSFADNGIGNFACSGAENFADSNTDGNSKIADSFIQNENNPAVKNIFENKSNKSEIQGIKSEREDEV